MPLDARLPAGRARGFISADVNGADAIAALPWEFRGNVD